MTWGVIEGWRFEVVEVTRVTAECYFYKNGARERRAWRTKLVATFEHQSTALQVAEKLTSARSEMSRREAAARAWFSKERSKIVSASGIEAATAGETAKHGSTEGESPAAAGRDAQTEQSA